MNNDTIHFILSIIAKELQICDLKRGLYLLERKNKLLKKLYMEARNIYNTMKAIAEPIHSYDDQMVAIAKWIESEFEYKPQKQVNNAAPELLEACKEAVRMYESVQPVGGWQGVYETLIDAIKKAESC